MCSPTNITPTEASDADLTAIPLEALEREITQLSAHINAATCRWLVLVGEFDRRQGWAEWGCKSCTHWVSYRCGLSSAAAREHVRVARVIAGLPEIRAAFGRGELCYSQVRAITRVATAETDRDLVEIARHATAAQLERVVRAYRGVLDVELGDAEPAHRRRYVRCEHDDDGSLLIAARLPAEEGAVVLAALEAGRDALREGSLAKQPCDESASAETPHIGDERAPGERQAVSNADAVLLMSQTLLASGPAERTGGDSYQVVVHVDAATLADDAVGGCGVEHGPPLSPETARRLACDASVVRILERDGRPLSVGRRTRSLPPALRRALRSRDRTCRYPGCAQRRFLHAHHVEHWARGGRTDLANLIHLCSFHHRLVHEGGYTVDCRGEGGMRFRRPDGREVRGVSTRLRGESRTLRRQQHKAGLALDDTTCVPQSSYERLQLGWVVGGLAEADPRLRE